MATLLETENITFRDLGITVGSQLTFNPHINEVVLRHTNLDFLQFLTSLLSVEILL